MTTVIINISLKLVNGQSVTKEVDTGATNLPDVALKKRKIFIIAGRTLMMTGGGRPINLTSVSDSNQITHATISLQNIDGSMLPLYDTDIHQPDTNDTNSTNKESTYRFTIDPDNLEMQYIE